MITTSTPLAASGKGRLLTLWILSALVALTFVGAGAAKLAGAAVMVDLFAKVGLGQWSCSSPSRDHRLFAKALNINQQRTRT